MCQELIFLKDSIMDAYMKSGYADKHFMPKGKEDKNGLRQGKWKDYEVINDFEYISIDGKPEQEFGYFLLYQEGEYLNDKRVGKWKFFAIEDKSFKKILQQEVTYNNGEKEGPYKYFYPSGKIGIVGTNTSGIWDGETKSYYESGNLYGTRFYIKGSATGRHTYLYSNGNLKFEQNFYNDTLEGLVQHYYPNGNIEESFNCKKGEIHGEYKYFYESGQLWVNREYVDGKVFNILELYDSEGNTLDFGTLKDGTGTVKYYTLDQKIYMIRTFENSEMIKEEEF